MTKNGGDIVKMWFRHRYTLENDPLKCHNSRENVARRIGNWQIRQPHPPLLHAAE